MYPPGKKGETLGSLDFLRIETLTFYSFQKLSFCINSNPNFPHKSLLAAIHLCEHDPLILTPWIESNNLKYVYDYAGPFSKINYEGWGSKIVSAVQSYCLLKVSE